MTMKAAGKSRATSAERSRSSALGSGVFRTRHRAPARRARRARAPSIAGTSDRPVLTESEQDRRGDHRQGHERDAIEHQAGHDGAEARGGRFALQAHQRPKPPHADVVRDARAVACGALARGASASPCVRGGRATCEKSARLASTKRLARAEHAAGAERDREAEVVEHAAFFVAALGEPARRAARCNESKRRRATAPCAADRPARPGRARSRGCSTSRIDGRARGRARPPRSRTRGQTRWRLAGPPRALRVSSLNSSCTHSQCQSMS